MDEYSPRFYSLDYTPNSSVNDYDTNSEHSEGEQDGVREQFWIAKRKATYLDRVHINHSRGLYAI